MHSYIRMYIACVNFATRDLAHDKRIMNVCIQWVCSLFLLKGSDGAGYFDCSTYTIPASSGSSKSSVPLYRASLALCWLSALYIALCRLPIALIWLPQLGSSLQGLQTC